MVNDEIVFDLETQRAFSDLADRNNFGGLGVSVLGCYSYGTEEFRIFAEDELDAFEDMLSRARRVIGYNIRHFDYPVLQPYMKSVVLKNLPTLDLILDPAGHLGADHVKELQKTLGAEDFGSFLAHAPGAMYTLGVQKSGHGLEAIRWFREGKLDELKRYCLDDVKLTKELYDHGVRHGHILIEPRYGSELRKIPVTWQRLPAAAVSRQNQLFS